jgi:hypothetical protein
MVRQRRGDGGQLQGRFAPAGCAGRLGTARGPDPYRPMKAGVAGAGEGFVNEGCPTPSC